MNEAAEFLAMLRRNGHVRDPQARLIPLRGGISSEIYVVYEGTDKFVVKRALPKLNAKDDWFADVHRNATERDYLECVGEIVPGAVPRLLFSSADDGYFGMELMGESFGNWKDMLLKREFRIGHAKRAGALLGEIHRRTACSDTVRTKFDSTANFYQLRVEPYLLTTGARHPSLQAAFDAEAKRIEGTREALVHGDFSPKNILIDGDRMVLLDCEVAWYGDPTFDVAFLLNHLFLKALYHAPETVELKNMVDIFWLTYAREISNPKAKEIEGRLVPLLLMLLMARVDGKSPVEYLTPRRQEFIRSFVCRHLPSPPRCFVGLCSIWFTAISHTDFTEANP